MKSLYTKILTLLLCSVIITALLIGGAGILNAEEAVKEDSARIMNLICDGKVQEINEAFLDIEQSVKTAYGYADSQLTDNRELWTDYDYMHEYIDRVSGVLENVAYSTDCALAAYLRLNPDILSPTEGVFFVRDDDSEGNFRNEPVTDISLYEPDDVSHVGWYYIPIENGGPTWLEPYENQNLGIKMISYIIPIYRDDMVIGVIGLDIDMSFLKNNVSEVSVYDTGYAFLACSNGDIVYHKQYPDGIATEEFDENLLSISDIMGDDRTQGTVYSYKWYGEDKQMVFHSLVNGMYLIITAPSSEINDSRNDLIIQCIIILLMVIAVVVVCSTCLVRQITKPLTSLTKAAEQITGGNWEVEIKCKTKDEVGVLATTLKKTINELRRYVRYVRQLAYKDVVTGVGNNQAYIEAVMGMEQDITAGNAEFAIMLINFNNFKQINDTYGYEKGDSLIISVSALIRKIFEKHSIYRICDDVFVVLLSKVSESQAVYLQKRFESEMVIFNKKLNSGAEEPEIVTGLACYLPGKDAGYSDVYVRADRKMYQQKANLNSRNNMVEDSLKILRMVFHKILKVNLTRDNYYEIKVYDDELSEDKGYSSLFSEWMEQFADMGQVYKDDLKEYYEFINREHLCKRLKAGETYMSFRYRRLVGDKFRWVQMEIIPSVEYEDDEQIVMLYVRDINDSYSAELEYQKKLERYTNTDTLTGLYNRHYMKQYFKDYVTDKKVETGIVFCDLNGLKHINDTYGHAHGDRLITGFANILKECFSDSVCCRMSGDEFLVIVLHKTEQEFMEQVENFLNREKGACDFSLASTGCCWRIEVSNIDEMLKKAEDKMYQDKKLFYRKYPMYRR